MLAKRCAVGLLVALFVVPLTARAAPQAATAGNDATAAQSANSSQIAPQDQTAPEIPNPPKETKGVRSRDKERAAKLYLESSKFFVNRQFEAGDKGI